MWFFDTWMRELRKIHEEEGYCGSFLRAEECVADWRDGLSPRQAFDRAEAESE